MPEIKNNFTGGKMNKDLDERLMPKGQYRDAVNVEVSTSEGSNVGTLQNVLGNARVDITKDFDGIPLGFKCVGSIADEKSNKLYWFVSSYEKDAILEYNPQTEETLPVFVDLNASNSKAALKFAGEIITGINIIDDLLLWTDNDSEPKKINIKDSKKGTVDFNSHTQLEFERGSFNGMTIELLANIASTHDFTLEKPKKGKYFWYEKKQLEKLLQQEIPYNETVPPLITNIKHYRDGKYIGLKEVTIWNNDSGMHVRLSDMTVDETNPLNPNNGLATKVGQTFSLEDWHEGDIIFGDNITLDIEERHITVIKPKPLKAPAIKINHTQPSESTSSIPNLFETTFPRFSYRYKYRDGEFSTFAPFTETVFNPKFPKDLNTTSTGNVFYNKDNSYTTEEPYNKAMENSIHSIELTDFITEQTPEDVEEIDILYKQENSSVIYSVGTIRHVDSAWHASSNHEGFVHDLGVGQTGTAFGYAAEGSYNKGKYVVTTENIYAALPANQLLRPWDNVPRRALAQEVTGSRVVYGNYLQNYDIGLLKPEVKVAYSDRNSLIGSFTTQGLPSVKSQRNYQVGVVYCDKYGRETPVFTSDKGAINIPWQKNDGRKNASRNLQLNPSVVANFPEWVDSLKFFVKETSNPYYNLAMERAWVSKATYELDNEDGHLWISFPSSDRNKITEEDYIVLKKKIGVGEKQIGFENKFKVIDIANEAPDSIKFRLVNYGTVSNDDLNTSSQQRVDALFDDDNERIDVETDTIRIDKSEWADNFGTPLEQGMGVDTTVFDPKDLYISWRKIGTGSGFGVSSKKYRITGGRIGVDNYTIKLSTPITKIDADIAHFDGDSSAGNTNLDLHDDLVVQVERKELKDDENFSGSFFVKISKNQVTNFIEEGFDVNIKENYIVSAKNKTWYWQDDRGTSAYFDDSTYGLTNHNGHYVGTYTSGLDSIHNAANNVEGDVNAVNGSSNTLKVTDYAKAWDGILSEFKPTFFIDSMHMVAGQSEASDYAKYCCVTWAGATLDNGWSYPPLKTWLTDFVNSENYTPNQAIDDGIGVTGKFHAALTNGTIDVSPLVAENDEYKFYDQDSVGQRVTGWVGQEQSVKRQIDLLNPTADHVNGLEGIVTTTDDHSTGPRRWFSGITGNSTEQGVGTDTNTYANNADDIGRHFMHLSFFAPGRNLVPDNFPATFELFGDNSVGSNLQGIWGGGHFTGTKNNETFGSDGDPTNEHRSLCLEGNNDLNDGTWLPETPGPGVGFGYDLDYRELHERQWDPTFNSETDPENKIRDFIRNLHTGAQFKFSTDTNDEIYTIKKVVVKKLYNHTSWRKPYNRYDTNAPANHPLGGYGIERANQPDAYISVEEAAMEWLDTLDATGINGGATEQTLLKDKIKDFGKASNRRLCYIIELDKNPASQSTIFNDGGSVSADTTNNDFANIEFLEQVQSVLLSELNKFPAIWEISPKKQQVDLDIYYEASNNIPVRLNSTTNELFAPIGCRVEVLDGPVTGSSYLKEWKNGTTAVFEPGFPLLAVEGSLEADYSGSSFKFIREDGSFTIAQAEEQILSGDINTVGFKTEFLFREDIGDSIRAGLSYYNCFSFNNGLESNRIRDDFNEMYIGNGVKASSTTQKTYEEERRSHGLIYSGLYNSNSGINDLNQFIMAEKITKDLNPTYGSIQKLFQRRISLIAFCEDRVVSIVSNKDALYNADGNPQLISTNLVLGDVNPFVGDYGISKNPESFASESYRAYFTDKQRGAVLRLSKDGLTPISNAGMHDWFRDNLLNYSALIGTYDSYKQNYNISLSHAFGENIIYNTSLDLGQESTSQLKTLLNYVANPGVNVGKDLGYGYDTIFPQGKNVLNDGEFTWGPQNRNLNADVNITMHPAIAAGELQEYIAPRTPEAEVPGNLAVIEAGYYASGAAIPNNLTEGSTAGMQLGTGAFAGQYGAYTTASQAAYGTGNIVIAQNATLNPLNSVGGANNSPTSDPEGGLNALNITGYTAAGVAATASQYLTSSASGYVYDEIGFGGSGPSFTQATYDETPGSDDGWWYDPRFTSVSSDLFGGNATRLADAQVYSTIKRVIDNNAIVENQAVGTTSPLYAGNQYYLATSWDAGFDPLTEKSIAYPLYGGKAISGCITRNIDTKAIVFDRPNPTNSYVEFNSIGENFMQNPGPNQFVQLGVGNNHSLYDYNAVNTPGTSVGDESHNSFFNGDEIHIQFELTCYSTIFPDPQNPFIASNWNDYGYNLIEPKLELLDGNQIVPPGNFVTLSGVKFQSNSSIYQPYNLLQTSPSDMGGDFETDQGYYPTVGSAAWLTSGSADYKCVPMLPMSSASVTFPSTSTITVLNTNYTLQPTGITKTIVCGASFKFRDIAQQNSNGTPITSLTSGNIEHKKVIDNLIIRISNAQGPSTIDFSTNAVTGSNAKLNNQLWEVNKVLIKKGFGITAPSVSQAAIGGQSAIQYSGATLYESVVAYVPPSNFVTYIPFEAEVTEIKEVQAVPPFPVPAWAEVQHQTFGWTKQGHGNYTNSYFSNLGTNAGGYGPSFGGISQSGLGQASNESNPPNVPISYTTPSNWDINSWNLDNTVAGAAGNAVSALGNPNYAYTSGFGGVVDGTPVITTVDQHLFINTPLDSGNESGVYLKFDITTNPWVAGDWYLVDLEFDDTWDDGGSFTSGLAGTGGDNGSCHVTQIAKLWSGALGLDIHPEGVGQYSNPRNLPNHSHVMLLPRVRNEYGNADGSGDGKNVIRGIFQASPDSLRFDTNFSSPTEDRNQFEIHLFNFVNSAKLETVIVKKLDYGLTEDVIGGNATSWEHTTDILTHSFAKRKIYWKDSKLCWSTLADNDLQWFQRFGNPTYQIPSYPPPHPGEYGWILKFTVNENPVTNNFVGKIRGYVNNNETTLGLNSNSYEGLYFSDIQDEGDYEIFFRTNGDETGWYINHSTDQGTTWVDYSGTANIQSTSSSGANSMDLPGLASLIMFIAGDATGAPLNLEGAISNISLKDQTLIFQGGSAGSWNFDGWDNSIAPYIIWNTDAGVNGLIEFNDCPIVDPLSGLALTTFLNANQFVDRNIDRFERFEIKFNYSLIGKVKIYYYNSEGYGFKISSIGDFTGSFKKTVEVGDEIWNWESPAGANYAPELKETFVIQIDDDHMLDNPSETVSGFIDNIKMTRVYNIVESENGETIFEEKTVTFSEDVNGWTSFKSFVPESGVSLSKKYYTIDAGGLFQHYVPLKNYYPNDGNASYFVSSSLDDAENYNMFYETHSAKGSSVRVILNNEPSAVKTFNTLNYEGTQAQVLKPSSIENITIDNAVAFNLPNGIDRILGWHCEDIKTNLDIGSVKQFIEKEGKWFNYIRGKETLNAVRGDAILDTSLFSVQGIGQSSSVTIVQVGKSSGNGSGASSGAGGTGGGGPY